MTLALLTPWWAVGLAFAPFAICLGIALRALWRRDDEPAPPRPLPPAFTNLPRPTVRRRPYDQQHRCGLPVNTGWTWR